MNEASKIQTHHLNRDACLYIRQSSMRQVIENVESTKRQYALRTRATALGWSNDRIVVIDSDQGKSGASTTRRIGFQHLVSEVGMGRVGIVMGLEVSRLARNNADWHRLLEICALTDTLILDEDGVYDPTSFNDRLLLGLKGAMSEAELHVLKARLRGGIINKARRGEYRCPLPTGLLYNEVGDVILDPDSQVREVLTYFFETFTRVGSASQTVKVFGRENLRFPSRIWAHGKSSIILRPLTASAAMRTLNNPRYAGVYAFGRRKYRRTADGKSTYKIQENFSDWTACIPDAHPGYITWDRYQENIKILKANGRGYEIARNSPLREGPALLQGRAVCGRCGSYLRVRYASRRGGSESWYICDRGSQSRGEPNCQSIAGHPIDKAVGALIVEKMTPQAIRMAIEIKREIEARNDELDLLRCQAIERAQVEVDLAQRRFMMVDPNNRLVAASLEAEWNEKLRILGSAQQEREQRRKDRGNSAGNAVQSQLIEMTASFREFWQNSGTQSRDRKRMLAHLVEDVTLVKHQEEGKTEIHVRFKGGKTESLTALNPKTSAQQIKTPEKIVALVDELLDRFIYSEIADFLNDQGFHPGAAARSGRHDDRFTSKHVAYLTHAYNLRSRRERLRQRGMLTAEEMGERLNVHEATVREWAKHGIVKRHAYNGRYYLYENPDGELPTKKLSRWNRLSDRVDSSTAMGSGNQVTNIEPE